MKGAGFQIMTFDFKGEQNFGQWLRNQKHPTRLLGEKYFYFSQIFTEFSSGYGMVLNYFARVSCLLSLLIYTFVTLTHISHVAKDEKKLSLL